MYEKFSPRVDKVIQLARAAAREADQEYLGTEHVLIAIVQEGTGIGAKLLNKHGIDEYRLKAEIEKLVKKSMEDTWVFGKLPGSPYLKSTVAAAVGLARQLDSKTVCTEHLVLAMLREKGSVAEQALRSLNLTFDPAHADVLELAAPQK